jgi:hypothetical protein
MDGSQIEIHYDPDGEWAALYVDGQLERVGDGYLAEERAFELLGVKTCQDNAFLRGQNERAGVARTLTEVAEYRAERERKTQRANELRAEAIRLLAEAEQLR